MMMIIIIIIQAFIVVLTQNIQGQLEKHSRIKNMTTTTTVVVVLAVKTVIYLKGQASLLSLCLLGSNKNNIPSYSA